MINATDKKKYHFNVIDVLLIVIVLAAISSLVFLLRDHRVVTAAKGDTVEIVYQVKFSGVREEFRNLVEIGDVVIDAETLASVGEVLNVAYAEGVYVGTDGATGKPVTSPYPGRITMTLTIKATALLTDNGYEVGGQELILGETLSLRTPAFTGVGTCLTLAVTQDGQ